MSTPSRSPAPDPATHLLVRHLVQARVAAGLSVEDLADRLGVTRQAVSAWENSDGSLRLSTLTRWATVLGLRVTLASGHIPVLRTPDGGPARPRTSSHTLLTGPGRWDLLPALLAEMPGLPHRRLDSARHLRVAHLRAVTVEDAVLGIRSAYEPGHDPSRSAQALVIDLDAEPLLFKLRHPGTGETLMLELLSRARYAGTHLVMLAVGDPASQPPYLRQNAYTTLVCHEGGTAATASPNTASEQTWHVA